MSNNQLKNANMGRLNQGGSRIDKEQAKQYVMERVIAADLRDT